MEEQRSRKKDWVLTREAFDLLLTRLDQNRDHAARKYEQIRAALLAYFEYHGSLSPAEHTDDTFNRVAHSLSEGKDIYIDNPAGYFYGVARNVLRQWHAEKVKRFLPLDDLPPSLINQEGPHELFKQAQERDDHEKRLECLEECLATLSKQNREFIVQYYDGETGVRINNRKSLAERLGISISLLRLRAMRVRERLEACVESCLGNN